MSWISTITKVLVARSDLSDQRNKEGRSPGMTNATQMGPTPLFATGVRVRAEASRRDQQKGCRTQGRIVG